MLGADGYDSSICISTKKDTSFFCQAIPDRRFFPTVVVFCVAVMQPRISPVPFGRTIPPPPQSVTMCVNTLCAVIVIFVMSFSCYTTPDKLTHPCGGLARIGNVPATWRVYLETCRHVWVTYQLLQCPAIATFWPAFLSHPSGPHGAPMARLTTAVSDFTIRKGSQLKPDREAMWSTSSL